MQLISLNTWGSRLFDAQMDFFARHAESTDIFCLQEVNDGAERNIINSEERADSLSAIQGVLAEHETYFAPQAPKTGLAILVRKSIPAKDSGFMHVLSSEETGSVFARALQWVILDRVAIYNFHGIPKGEKLDTPLRQRQGERVLEAMAKNDQPKVIVGDFNLRPDTECLRVFERGMRNLVIEGGFSTTRNHHYEERGRMPFADYVFVSPEISVKDFQILQDEVSDHMALQLAFE